MKIITIELPPFEKTPNASNIEEINKLLQTWLDVEERLKKGGLSKRDIEVFQYGKVNTLWPGIKFHLSPFLFSIH